MMIHRRTVLTGMVATAVVAGTGRARAATGARGFDIRRGDTLIGGQSIAVRQDGDETVAESKIDIAVKFFGITAYRYTLESRERWRGGRLIALDSTCDDDGTSDFVRAVAVDGGLKVDGSRHQGILPADIVPSSYWSSSFLTRPTWISIQSGAPMAVTCAKAGETTMQTAQGPRPVSRWNVSGELELTLFYSGDEWAGNAFDAKGEVGLISAKTLGPALGPLAPHG
jgi:hypothetical protein